MRKVCMAALALLMACAAVAQPMPSPGEARQEWVRQHLLRQPAMAARGAGLPLAGGDAAVAVAAKGRRGMPASGVWFPGEWEEVQAVVVTPVYVYKPLGVARPDYWEAEPLVPGWADLYEYARVSPSSRQYGWQYRGTGAYTGTVDTASDMARVPFLLMDAIQQGGAQAWVHVERYADSAVVLRQLAAMGLRRDRVRFFEAPANSFWYRDCGPVCFYYGDGDTVGMLDFQYYSGRALDDSLPVYLERRFGLPRFPSAIEWEGGNCLVDGAGMVFSSDRIYSANADDTGQYVWDGADIASLAVARKAPLDEGQVRDSLRRLLGPRGVHVLPSYQYDGGTGHVDLYADMRDENTFVFSKMPVRYSRWADYATGIRNMDSLCSYRAWSGERFDAEEIPFPSRDNGAYFTSQLQYEEFTRTYSNHVFVNRLIIQPCFSAVGADGLPTAQWDRANISRVAEAYPGYTLYCIDVRSYDGLGGAIHCLTKQIPAESPVRILHAPVRGAEAGVAVPVSAVVTNNKGIGEVWLRYRVDGGAWDSVSLAPGADSTFTGELPPVSPQQAGAAKVEYYISATSREGKTVTKPMTACQGGYYAYTVGGTEGIPVADGPEGGFGQFYPSPATAKADMRIDMGGGGEYSVSVFDLGGRLVHAGSLCAAGRIVFSIDVSRLPAGLYTVVFAGPGGRVARRLSVR